MATDPVTLSNSLAASLNSEGQLPSTLIFKSSLDSRFWTKEIATDGVTPFLPICWVFSFLPRLSAYALSSFFSFVLNTGGRGNTGNWSEGDDEAWSCCPLDSSGPGSSSSSSESSESSSKSSS